MNTTHLTRRLEQISVSKCCAQAKYVISLGVLRNWLHYRTVNYDQMLRGRLHGPTLSRITRVEQEGGSLQTDPVTFPTSLPRQLDLVLFTKEPLLDAQKSETRKRDGFIVVKCVVKCFWGRIDELYRCWGWRSSGVDGEVYLYTMSFCGGGFLVERGDLCLFWEFCSNYVAARHMVK